MRFRRSLVALGTLSLLGSFLVVPPTATAGVPDLTVRVGAPLFEMPEAGGAPADGMRFYAPPLNVHDGDTVTFAFDGFHTATLLPANTDADAWVEANASDIGEPFFFLLDDPDDNALKVNNAVAFPTVGGAPATCGTEANPCTAGSAVVNSGPPFGPGGTFTVTIDGNVGDTITVLCLIHPARMQLDITIVASAAEATTQAEVDAFHAETMASDATKARRLHDRLLDRQTGTPLSGGRTRWDAFAGVDGAGFALIAFYPTTLEIERGDTVRWHSDRLRFEDHTVAMPFGKARNVFRNSFVPLCDVDGEGSEPRQEPDLQEPPFCSTGELELSIPLRMAFARGNGVFKGRDYENSGIFGANANLGPTPYDVTFRARSTGKGFRYMCLIHGPFMSGRVRVG